MTQGRPSKYNSDAQEAADNYVNGGFVECKDIVPSVAGLACELGVRRSTMYEWADKHEKFSDTLDRLKQFQERLLLSGSLSGDHNATIAKLMLANHGYSDKSKQEITGAGGGPVEWVVQPVKPKD